MNSERRHELQQNILASYLGRVNQSIEPYSRIIAIVLAVVILGGISFALIRSKKSGDRSDATLRLIQAVNNQDPEVLEKVGLDFPDTPAGSWSKLYQGDEYLSEGIRQLFTSRETALDTLEQAKLAFEGALASSDDQLLQSRANFGIGRACESRGDIEEAIAAYEQCIETNESEAMVEKAQERVNTLTSPETKAFLAWFSKQDFSPPAPTDPSLPPSLPGLDSIPGVSDIKLPKLDGASDRELGDGLNLPKIGGASDRELGDGLEMPKDDDPEGDNDAEATDSEAKDAEAKDAEAKDAEVKDAEAKDDEAKDDEAKDAEAKDAEVKDDGDAAAGTDESAADENGKADSTEKKTDAGDPSEPESVKESNESDAPASEETPGEESPSEADSESPASDGDASADKDAGSDQE